MYELLFKLMQLEQEGVDEFKIYTDTGCKTINTEEMVIKISQIYECNDKMIVGEIK